MTTQAEIDNDPRPLVYGYKMKKLLSPNKDTGSPDVVESAELVRIVIEHFHQNVESMLEFVKDGLRFVGYKNLEHPKFEEVRDYIDQSTGKGIDPRILEKLNTPMTEKIENAKRKNS